MSCIADCVEDDLRGSLPPLIYPGDRVTSTSLGRLQQRPIRLHASIYGIIYFYFHAVLQTYSVTPGLFFGYKP